MISVQERLDGLIKDSEQMTSKWKELQTEHHPKEIQTAQERAIEEFRNQPFRVFTNDGQRAVMNIKWDKEQSIFVLDEYQTDTILGDLMNIKRSASTTKNNNKKRDKIQHMETLPASMTPEESTTRSIDIPDPAYIIPNRIRTNRG